jgi:hypothetical protein
VPGNLARSPPRTFPGIQIPGDTAAPSNYPHVNEYAANHWSCSTQLSFCALLNSVCIRDAKEAFSVRPRFPENFTYMVLDVEDNEEQNLIRLFPG